MDAEVCNPNAANDGGDTDCEQLEKGTKHLLSIFPEELWLMISDHLTDPNDFENFSNASPFFQKCLLPKYTLRLFPKVWQILEKNYRSQCSQDFSLAALRRTVRCPSCERCRYSRPYSGILKLRLVCKTWSATIDNFYQNRESLYKLRNYVGSKEEDIVDSDLTTETMLRTHHNAGKFIEHFNGTHDGVGYQDRNPFIGRKVHITTRMPTTNLRDRVDPGHPITSLLQTYGHHIWHCDIGIEEQLHLTIPMYSRIRNWLCLMPNLKTLKISYKSPMGVDSIDSYSVGLRYEMKLNGLPSFQNLQVLWTVDLPEILFNHLIQRNNHVSTLEVDRRGSQTKYDFLSLQMSNMKQLSIKISATLDTYIFAKRTSLQGNSPLSTLQLDLGDKVFMDCSIIFAFIKKKWAETLTNLTIRFPTALRDEDEQRFLEKHSSLRLKLPRVKALKVIIGSFSSLDFILPMMGSLETLDVYLNYDLDRTLVDKRLVMEEGRKQTIQFLGYHACLYESNIWNMFTNLKRVRLFTSFISKSKIVRKRHSKPIERWSYTRHGWINK